MARICNKCGNKVPRKIWIDGKQHNLQNRKYCLDCSPYGEHNTVKLEELKHGRGKCKICGNPVQRGTNSSKCYSCYFKEKQSKKIAKVQKIVGNSCWICGYNKTWRNIAFHHVDPSQKLMNLSTREFVGHRWNLILPEIQKCILVCHNCHG